MTGTGSPDWAHMNVGAIWALLAGDNLEHAANRPNDWDNLATALDESKKRLDAAAKQLDAVWPAADNDAAQAFQNKVSVLLGSMQETLSKAQNTKSGLDGVITALSTAKDTVAKLKQERESKANDIIPRWIDHAEDHLDTQAQEAMRQAEAAVADHSADMQAPALYTMTVSPQDAGRQKVGGPSGGGSGKTTLRAEPVGVTKPAGSTFDYPVTGDGAGSGPAGAPVSSGPVLSGVLPIGSAPVTALPPVSPLGGVPAGIPGGPTGFPAGLGVLPLGAGALPPGAGGLRGFGTPAAPVGVRQPVAVRTAMPSGAVIGEDSERGIAPRGTAAGQNPMTGGGRGGRGRRGDSDDVLEGEADQLWRTREGVAAVIEPDRTPARHDPGPGVIGYPR